MKKKKIMAEKPVRVRNMEKALRMAARKAVEEHKRTGNPLVVWRNGRVKKVSPDRA
jgi:hypothetical protein